MMGLFKKILVAYDGSDYSRKALDIACMLAGEHGSVVRVLYVVDASHAWVVIGGIELSLKERLVGEARKLLGEAVAYARERYGVSVEEKVRVGHPANDIVEEAEEWGADLIVVGAKGVSGLKRLLLGSVAGAVVQSASCSVLIVR